MEQLIKEIEDHLAKIGLTVQSYNIHGTGSIQFISFLCWRTGVGEEIVVAKVTDGKDYNLYVELI